MPENVRTQVREASKITFSGLFDRSPSPLDRSLFDEADALFGGRPAAAPSDAIPMTGPPGVQQTPAGGGPTRTPLTDAVERANTENNAGRSEEARIVMKEAYDMVPIQDRRTRATISHDMAVLHENQAT